MSINFDKESAVSNLKEALRLLEEGGSRSEFGNLLLSTMGGGACDLHCITANEEFLQKILDMLPVPVYYKDIFGVYLGCNDALAKLYEKPKDKIIGKTVFDIFTPEEAEHFSNSDTILISEKRNELIEHKGKFSAMGNSFHVIHKKIILTPVGNVSGILGIIMDISEHKANEERAWQGEAFYKSLFENSPRARVVFDSFNLIEDMNIAATELFKEAQSFVGTDISVLFESYEDFEKVMNSNGKPVRVNLVNVEDEAVEALASLTVVGSSEMPWYAISFIVMDTVL